MNSLPNIIPAGVTFPRQSHAGGHSTSLIQGTAPRLLSRGLCGLPFQVKSLNSSSSLLGSSPPAFAFKWSPSLTAVQGPLPELCCRPPTIILGVHFPLAFFKKRAVEFPYYHRCWGPLPPAITSRRPPSLVDLGTCPPSPLQEGWHLLIQVHLPETVLEAARNYTRGPLPPSLISKKGHPIALLSYLLGSSSPGDLNQEATEPR